MFTLEGKRGVGGKPYKPGVIISYEYRSFPVVPGKEPITVSLRRPEERVRGGFWHRFLLNRLVIPNSVFWVIIPIGLEECKCYPTTSYREDRRECARLLESVVERSLIGSGY